jgi:hypothetical protein
MRRLLSVPAALRLPVVLAITGGLALTACAGEADTAAPEPTVSATTAAPAPAPPAEPTAEPAEDDAQVVAITYAGGQVSGVEARTSVALGTRIRLSITSDVPEEVHVHGFDLTEQLTPGQTAQIEFVADQPGVFTIELHDAGTALTRLQVQ